MSNNEFSDFMKYQAKIIRKYVEECGKEDKNFNAIKWIEDHACQFRKEWDKNHY